MEKLLDIIVHVILSVNSTVGQIRRPSLHITASNHLHSPLITAQSGNMIYHREQNLSRDDPTEREGEKKEEIDRILMKQW